MNIDPIGIFQCAEEYPYDAARQGTVSHETRGVVELNPGHNFEQGLSNLGGFSHIWIAFQFHKNEHWKPMIQPPRGNRKVGVFASRAPYRPNGIGFSCVRLEGIKGRTLEVLDHDLLNGTPILDIKPYLPYADSFPEATIGWIDEDTDEPWNVVFRESARAQIDWLQETGVDCLEAFLRQQLAHDPTNSRKKRVRKLGEDFWEIAYRTWRAEFVVDDEKHAVVVSKVYSGYSAEDLQSDLDRYKDKPSHRNYREHFRIL